MNEQIKELALQVEAQYCDLSDASIFKRLGLTEAVVFRLTDLEKFANLVEAHEREACAKIADDWDKANKLSNYGAFIALQIRARGTT